MKELYEHLKKDHHKVGIISEQTDFPQDYKDALVELSKDSTPKILEENFLPETKDYRAMFLRLRAKNIDGLILNSQAEAGLVRLVKQLSSIQWKVPIFSNFYPSSPSFLNAVGDLANGIVFNDAPPLAAVVTKDGKKLYDEYYEIYGEPKSSELYFVTTLLAFQALDSAIL